MTATTRLFEKVDFGTGVSSVDVRLASAASTAGTLELHLDSGTGPLIATVHVPLTGGWQKMGHYRQRASRRRVRLYMVTQSFGAAAGSATSIGSNSANRR